MLREKTFRTLEVVAVAFEAGFFQSISHLLLFDYPEGSIGPRLATGRQFFDPLADVVKHWPFVQSLPRGHKTDCRHRIFGRFLRRFENGLRINEPVARGVGVVGGRLRAKAAVIGAPARLRIYNRAEMDLVALEGLANAIGPRQQIKNIGRIFQLKQRKRLFLSDLASTKNSFTQFGYPLPA